ncbi:putative histidine kinase [Methanocella paludicola SANAE]|uniref:histidine kinase n=1 Tax=Methanocella paludicola (strain DSM 17711 / JCM 13418 / NBRC 101707 / SANAE) TaxID=304371 RepID=D1Z2D4_METPS|nr:PAS domain S-box protein [Methanocella paludicola]BAI62856.1 putative histidine kinase [Methanocella paludicola SANAE]
MVGMLPEDKGNFYDRLHDSVILPSSIVEFYPDATLVVDNGGRVVAWNKAMGEMTGVPAEDMLGKGNYEYSIPFYGKRMPILVDMVGLPREEVSSRYTNIIVHGDTLEALTIKAKVKGRDVVLWGTAARLYGLNGKPVGAIESIRDVTAQDMVERKLMESEEKYRTIITSTNDAIITVDTKGIITYVNPSGIKMMGRPYDDIIGRHFTYFVVDAYKDRAIQAFSQGMVGSPVPPLEIEMVDGDGRQVPIELSGGALHSGRVKVGAIVTFRDVSERWKAHERLERRVKERTEELALSEEKFRVLAETTSSAIFIYQKGRFRYVNPATCRITGYSEEELLTMNFWDWVHPDYQELVKRNGRARRHGQLSPPRYEIKFVTRGGEERWAELTPGLIEYNKRPAILVTAVDITDRKRTEEALKNSKENAEMYLDLMGHDINNMDQVALGYLEMAMKAVQEDDPVYAYISRSYAMLQESSRLIDNLRKVQQAVDRKLRLEAVDLGAILSEVAEEYSIVPGRDVTIEYRPVECQVMASRLLKDVFSNIVGNAVKHSTGPLKVSIGVRPCVHNGVRCCEVSVEDDGPGIPEGLKDAIFSRMKRGSTKAPGSGLGLYIVRSLVEGFNGRVWAEDRVPGKPGDGSRFVVQLPSV